MKKTYKITGMSCAACAKSIESAINKIDGVDIANVNLLTEIMEVEYSKDVEKDVFAKVIKLGYGINNNNKQDDKLANKELINLIITIILSFAIMIIAMGTMFGVSFFKQLMMYKNGLLNGIIQLVLLIPIIILNFDVYKKGIFNLISFKPNMDSLISIGSISAIVYSLYQMVSIFTKGNMAMHYYFETSAMIIMIIKIGKYLEDIAKSRTKKELQSIAKILPNKATILKDNEFVDVALSNVNIDDIILVKAGQRIPLDGIIIEGTGIIDESSITGEANPVTKYQNSEVFASTINITSPIKIKTTSIDGTRYMDNVIKLVNEASSTKAPIERIADKISRIFVPIVILISIITFSLWLIITKNFENSFLTAISVLVIACPCSLGLATPTSIMVGIGVGARYKILFKNALKLEELHKVDVIVFDKTGTLTKGVLKVEKIDCFIDKDEALKLAKSLELNSNHPIAKTIVNIAKNQKTYIVNDACEIVGSGISGIINENSYYIGSKNYLDSILNNDLNITSDYNLIYLFDDKNVLAIFYIGDEIKESSKKMIEILHDFKIKTVMLTGDNYSRASIIANNLGIDEVIYNATPTKKDEYIKELSKNHIVCMVGDGINDAIAISRANVGIAVGSGTDVAIECADVVINSNNMEKICDAINISKKTFTNIKQNLFWALFYNMIAVCAAVGLYYLIFKQPFNPIVGAFAMSLSSIFVVTNALRLNKIKPLSNKEEVKVMNYKIYIDGMMCMHCVSRVQKALEEIGAKNVTISLEDKIANAVFPYDNFDETIINKIVEVGYSVIKIEK